MAARCALSFRISTPEKRQMGAWLYVTDRDQLGFWERNGYPSTAIRKEQLLRPLSRKDANPLLP
jgi:hypothetical protein